MLFSSDLIAFRFLSHLKKRLIIFLNKFDFGFCNLHSLSLDPINAVIADRPDKLTDVTAGQFVREAFESL